MYKTNSTNGVNSAVQSKSFVHIQGKICRREDRSHNTDLLIVEQVFNHYHNTLRKQPKLIKALTDRKIDPYYIDHFQIGFSDRTLGYELQSSRCLVGSRNRGHLQRLGILKDTGHEFFHGALVIPYCDANGHITGAYGRRLRHQRTSPAYHLYWNAQQASLFNAANQRLPETIILCKSALDSLTLLTAGFENVVATMGTHGFNDIQLSQLYKDGVARVFVAFDNTPSVNQYALLVAQALGAIGIRCYHIKLPPGQDVNSFALGQTDVANAFSKLIEEAESFKQQYQNLFPGATDHWLEQFETIGDCIQFYLDEIRFSGKSARTFKSNRNHLQLFWEYCQDNGVERVSELTFLVLDSYWQYLRREKNSFTGKVISCSTQEERMSVVNQMLARLHYYGVIPEPLSFSANNGVIH